MTTVDRESSVWPAETVEARSQRLLEAIDQTGILNWTPKQREALEPTVDDFLRREFVTQETLRKRADRAQALLRRVAVIGVILSALTICGAFGAVLLASHLSAPAVVIQAAPTPTPVRHP